MDNGRTVYTRFYRNKSAGKVMGLCAGIADYVGMDVNLVRMLTVVAAFVTSGAVIPIYFIAAWMTPDKPNALDQRDGDKQRFWQGVRASPSRSAAEIRSRMREIDRRLADVEHYVTTSNRPLSSEIDRLR